MIEDVVTHLLGFYTISKLLRTSLKRYTFIALFKAFLPHDAWIFKESFPNILMNFLLILPNVVEVRSSLTIQMIHNIMHSRGGHSVGFLCTTCDGGVFV